MGVAHCHIIQDRNRSPVEELVAYREGDYIRDISRQNYRLRKQGMSASEALSDQAKLILRRFRVLHRFESAHFRSYLQYGYASTLKTNGGLGLWKSSVR